MYPTLFTKTDLNLVIQFLTGHIFKHRGIKESYTVNAIGLSERHGCYNLPSPKTEKGRQLDKKWIVEASHKYKVREKRRKEKIGVTEKKIKGKKGDKIKVKVPVYIKSLFSLNPPHPIFLCSLSVLSKDTLTSTNTVLSVLWISSNGSTSCPHLIACSKYSYILYR